MYILPQLPVSLPTTPVHEDVDLEVMASSFSHILNNLREHHFTKNAVWRDLFALTGTIRTFYTAHSVSSAWFARCQISKPKPFVVEANGRVVRMYGASWVELPFIFETDGIPNTICGGFVSVVPEDGGWKIWCLRTILEQLKGAENVDFLRPVEKEVEKENGDAVQSLTGSAGVNGYSHLNGDSGTQSASNTNGLNGANGHNVSTDAKIDFDCIVIGGGQAGLATGGRMQALGISYVIIDKHPDIGDSWKSRYQSTKRKLHLASFCFPSFCLSMS